MLSKKILRRKYLLLSRKFLIVIEHLKETKIIIVNVNTYNNNNHNNNTNNNNNKQYNNLTFNNMPITYVCTHNTKSSINLNLKLI